MTRKTKNEEVAELVKIIEDARTVRLAASASYLKTAEKPRWIQPTLREITAASIDMLAWVELWARYCLHHVIHED